MPLEPQTQEYQEKLAAFCRTDTYEPVPGIREDRVDTYRRLVFNVVEETLQKAFPITHSALSAAEWHDLVHVFFESHDSESPLLWRMPYGLVEFAARDRWAERLEKPYLNDLLRFEWLEIEVYMMPDSKAPTFRRHGDLQRDLPIVNPEHRIQHFEYPVFKLSPQELEAAGSPRGDYNLLCFRHPEQLNVRFVELSQEFTKIFEELIPGSRTGKEILRANLLRFSLSSDKREQAMESGERFLAALLAEGAILGFHP